MDRRGFLAALGALVAAPALAWERRRPRWRRTAYYFDDRGVLRCGWCFNPVPLSPGLGPRGWGRRYMHHECYEMRNRIRLDPHLFVRRYNPHLRGLAVDIPLPRNYKSPARLWWESYLKRRR